MELTEEERTGYLEALLSVVSADGLLDKVEIIKIYELFYLFRIDIDERREIMERLVVNPFEFQNKEVCRNILANEGTKFSLAKDLFLFQHSSLDQAANDVVRSYINQLNLTSEQYNIIYEFVEYENDILSAVLTGKKIFFDEQRWEKLVVSAKEIGVTFSDINLAGLPLGTSMKSNTSFLNYNESPSISLTGTNSMKARIISLILSDVSIKRIIGNFPYFNNSIPSNQLEDFKKSRLIIKEAISLDRFILCRERKSELIHPSVMNRRQVLNKSMEESLIELDT